MDQALSGIRIRAAASPAKPGDSANIAKPGPLVQALTASGWAGKVAIRIRGSQTASTLRLQSLPEDCVCS
jgi:hypothetical protein